MKIDRKKWNDKYSNKSDRGDPSELIVNFHHLASGPSALDIACGNGRNGFFLAEKGFQVDAVDISDVAIAQVFGQHPSVNAICADLDTFEIDENSYDLIANIRFLDRKLFAPIFKGLTKGGILLFESFSGNPDDPYCLDGNELLTAFMKLNILYYKVTRLEPGSRFPAVVQMAAEK